MEVFNNIINDYDLELDSSCLTYCKSKGNDLIHFLVKDSRKEDSFNLLKEYLDDHPDKVNLKNEDGWTALMMASRYSNTISNNETVKLLFECGADPNIQNESEITA